MPISYLILISFLTGCSFASYDHIDGATEFHVTGVGIGTDRAFEGLIISSDKVQLSLTNDQVTQTKGFKAAVEGAVSAILKTVVPLP